MTFVQTTLQTEEKYSLPRGFSPSYIIGYRSCPRQFFIRYVLKVKPDFISPILEMGSRVHTAISQQVFRSDNPDEHAYLQVAREMLAELPGNPVFETTYDDPSNPGMFKGRCFSYPFIGFFDIHWVDPAMGADWKTGSYKQRKNPEYEIQAYILNELYQQKQGYKLNEFRFIFLADGEIYRAKSITPGSWRDRTEGRIKDAIRDIHAYRFPKKRSFACDWCEVSEYCRLDCGMR
jgi:hypothetical protein